jgi:hypothetical protein
LSPKAYHSLTHSVRSFVCPSVRSFLLPPSYSMIHSLLLFIYLFIIFIIFNYTYFYIFCFISSSIISCPLKVLREKYCQDIEHAVTSPKFFDNHNADLGCFSNLIFNEFLLLYLVRKFEKKLYRMSKPSKKSQSTT